jgi:hypothetical protein
LGKIRKWERVRILVKRYISHDPVSEDRNFITESAQRIVVGPGDEEVDILEYDNNLHNDFQNLEDYQKEKGVKETKSNFLAGQRGHFDSFHLF